MNSCKDEAKNVFSDSFNSLKVSVNIGDSLEINKQLSWIAKGVAGLTHQVNAIKTTIHSQVELSDFNSESNEHFQTIINNNQSIDYEDEVYNWINVNIPNNDYDRSYFFEIDLYPCESKTLISIPDAEDVDKTLLHVVTISPVTVDDNLGQVTGYYINTLGLLDSLQITENNVDSFYLWIIEFIYDCELELSDWSASSGDCPPCKGSKCRPECGDKWPDCVSCPEPTNGLLSPPNPHFKLELVNVKYKADKKNCSGSIHFDDYQENFLKGRYQLRIGWVIYEKDNMDNYLRFQHVRMQGKHPVTKNFVKHGEGHKKAGRFRPYKKGGGKRHNCNNPNSKDRNDQLWAPILTLTHHYYPHSANQNENTDICAFYLMEYDCFMGNLMPTIDIPIFGQLQLEANTVPYSFVHNQNQADPDFNDLVHVLPPLPGWTQINPDLYLYTAVFDEAEVTFRLSK